MNRESLGEKQQPQMIRGPASVVFSSLIPAGRPSADDNKPDIGVELLQTESTVDRNHP